MRLVVLIKFEFRFCCEFSVSSGPLVWVKGLGCEIGFRFGFWVPLLVGVLGEVCFEICREELGFGTRSEFCFFVDWLGRIFVGGFTWLGWGTGEGPVPLAKTGLFRSSSVMLNSG